MIATRPPTYVLALAALALLLAACEPLLAPAPTATPTAEAVVRVTTVAPPMAPTTAAPIATASRTPPPTRTPPGFRPSATPCVGSTCPTATPTRTPWPTSTPTATPTPTRTPPFGDGKSLPLLETIAADNSDRLALLARLGGAGHPAIFSPDGEVIHAAGKLYRARDGSLIGEIEGSDPVFSPDGTLLVTASEETDTGTVRLYRTSDGNLLHEFAVALEGHQILLCMSSPVFSPDSSLLVEGLVPCYGPDGNLLALRTDTSPLEGTLSRARKQANVLAAPWRLEQFDGADHDCQQSVCLWRMSDGSLAFEAEGWMPMFSPDGTLLAAGGRVYRTSDGSLAFEVEGSLSTFSPDGTLLATGSCAFGECGGPAHLYRVSDGSLVRELEGDRPRFSEDGTLLVTEGSCDLDGCAVIRLYQTGSGKLVFEAAGQDPVFSRDGSALASVSPDYHSVWLYRTSDGIMALEALGHTANFSPDGRLLVVYDWSGWVILYRVSDDKLILALDDYPAFSPDGTLLAASAYDGGKYTVGLCRASDGGLLFSIVGRAPTFSPSGTLLAIATDAGIELWGIAP